MNYKTSKKGAVELSLNLIIMLIIGMVVLGLVIGFVNSLVGRGAETFNSQMGDNEKLKLDDVRSCPGNLCVNPTPSINIKKGGNENVFIKVRVFQGSDAMSCKAGELNSCNDEKVSYEVVDSVGDPIDNALTLVGPGFQAKVGDEDAQMYTLKADKKEAQIGTYYLSIHLFPNDEEHKETVTITVNVS